MVFNKIVVLTLAKIAYYFNFDFILNNNCLMELLKY